MNRGLCVRSASPSSRWPTRGSCSSRASTAGPADRDHPPLLLTPCWRRGQSCASSGPATEPHPYPSCMMAPRLHTQLAMNRQQRIATLTANPALDASTTVPQLVPDRKLRCTEPLREPGGGGINVARAIHMLRGDAIACFPAGGPTGDLVVSLLEREGVPRRVVRVHGSSRENVHVVESASGSTSSLREQHG